MFIASASESQRSFIDNHQYEPKNFLHITFMDLNKTLLLGFGKKKKKGIIDFNVFLFFHVDRYCFHLF